MAVIFIDTNKFIDFYQEAKDPLALLDEIKTHTDKLIVTDQVYNEFHQNRVATLKWLINEFAKTTNHVAPRSSSILNAYGPFAELKTLLNQAKGKAKEIRRYLESIVSDITADPVAKLFDEIYESAAFKLDTALEIIDAARHRKLLGRPPTSPDKHTIGDEVIWETLLAHLRDDLILVSRDKTYSDNLFLLSTEFTLRTKHTIRITENVADALRLAGEVPSDRLKQEETQIAEQLPQLLPQSSGSSGRAASTA
ncbi:MAG: hypothetical protein JWN70_4521 [Planctomycetaceae bacterium]|nr:hypothetical protein [Planctomycetaceae bacterium]